MNCPLCASEKTDFFEKDRRRSYFRCQHCALVFVPAFDHLSLEDEEARYRLHRNDRFDEPYIDFLSRIIVPLTKRVQDNSHGLDFGSGPVPVFSELLKERGFHMDIFDPFFANSRRILRKEYDFVTCIEAVEHFRDPEAEFDLITNLVKPAGWIAIMTELLDKSIPFSSWHYKGDPTHICFYCRKTFSELAERYHLKLEFEGSSMIFLQQKSGSGGIK